MVTKLLGEDTDATWRSLAREDPYFAVLTVEEGRGVKGDPERHAAFMATGAVCIDTLFTAVPEFTAVARGTAIDFGCGVGRLLLPLAARFDRAIGIDVADVMLAEARDNAAAAGLTNVALHRALSEVQGRADLVHSQIVLQHIPVERGLALIAEMWSKVELGGLLAIQFPIRARLSRAAALRKSLIARAPWLRPTLNRLSGMPPEADRMQMNVYPLNDVIRQLHDTGANRIAIHEWPSDPWHDGVYLFATRQQPHPP